MRKYQLKNENTQMWLGEKPEALDEDVKTVQMELAAEIRQLRLEEEMSVESLAKLTGVSTRTIWRLEAGETIRVDSLLKTLFILDSDIELA